MIPKQYRALLAVILFTAFSVTSVQAQTTDAELTATILKQDSLFWKSYNTCDTAANKKFFTTDIEFYHDKGGITLGAENLAASLKNNLCSNPDYKLRRAEVAGSVQVFPMRNATGIYGAVITGEHVFYITQNGNPETLDGQARFTHLWLRQPNGDWKMTRILSYDHHPAEAISKHQKIKLSDAVLSNWAGTYKGAQSGTLTVQKASDGLLLLTNNKTMVLYPEAENRFFSEERDLVFEFTKDAHGVLKMLVREGGRLAEELTLVTKR